MTTYRRRATALLAGATLTGLALGACSQDPTTTVRPVAAPVAVTAAVAPPTARPAVQQVPVPAATSQPAATRPIAPAAPAAPADPNALPWSQVGVGWSAAVYSTHPNTAGGSDPVGPFTVALVSPAGRHWTVGESASLLTIDDVAPDGGHVLATRQDAGSSELVELDTRTHAWRDIRPAMTIRQAFYSNPTAQQIVLTTFDGVTYTGTQRVERIDRHGRTTLDVRYPSTVMSQVVPTGDGRLFVTGRTDTLAVLDNATGAVVRTVAAPQGYHDCRPQQLWTGSRVTVACDLDAVAQSYVSDILLLDAATGHWSAVTHADVTAPTFGYAGAWPVPSGAIAMEAVGCGPGRVGPLDRDGRVSSFLSWPGASANPMIVGVTGNRAYATYGSCGGSPSMKLVGQDVSSHRSVVLLAAQWLDAAVIDGR